ncbi:WDcontaining protein 34 [Angomonas deanei]|nr:WDcontaining protein 34 [Angomonas deanei]|eukprot:EPY39335.1 WDcontaining protein 34 [Angomonas deanei]
MDFKNQLTGEIYIPSTWQKKVSYAESAVQTVPLEKVEVEVQTTISSLQTVDQLDKNVSTSEDKKPLKAVMEGLQYAYAGVEYDHEKLATFLEAAKEDMLAILYKNAKSSAFDNYAPNWSKQNTDLSEVYTFTSPHATDGKYHALDISWNSNGTMLAVGYGRIDTSGWCYKGGYVCIWNLIRPDLDCNAPHYTLETDTYVTCLSFHPTNSQMLAVGTYSGEVIVFPNVYDSVPEEYSSNQSPVNHQEPITSLYWLLNLQEIRDKNRYLLCSSGQDGQITFWSPQNKMTSPIAVYGVKNKRRIPVGIQTMCHSRSAASDKDSINTATLDAAIMIGLESGDLGRGRTGFINVDADPAIQQGVQSIELDWMDGHRGPIQKVCPSPFFRNLFATCSSDGSAHLYTDMERSPALLLEPSTETKHFLYDVQFSPFRPSVLALASRSSSLHLYDLQKIQSKPVYSVEAGSEGSALVCLRFNPSSPEFVAAGDTNGTVHVWKLPSDLTQMTEQERNAVRAHATGNTKDAEAKEGAVPETANESKAIRALLGFNL